MKKLLIGCLSMCSACALAADPDMPDTDFAAKPYQATRLTLVGGITQGGDTLAEVGISGSSDEKIKAGQLLLAGVGLNYRGEHQPMSYQINAGYHWDSVTVKNGEVTIDRIALDVLAYWEFHERHRIGVGALYHLNPTLEIDLDFAPSEKAEFDSSLGAVVEYGFRFVGTGAVVSLRYASIEYSMDGFEEKADASHVGVVIYAYF
jgi:hypothetical protein